jgi:hypothetical protein
VSCTELERLFTSGASAEEAQKHRDVCPTCRAAGADADATEEIAAALAPPAMPSSLRRALLEIPRRTVSCEGAERLLPIAIENELLPDDERRLASHLSRCGACSEAAATLAAARDLSEPIAPPWLAGRLAAARPTRRGLSLGKLFGPKSVIAFAYGAAVLVMILGFNPADLARRVGAGDLGQNTRAAVLVAESSVTDRLGALQERVARTLAVWRGRAGGYGRAAVSNVVSLIWKSSGAKPRPVERPRNRDGRGALRERETTTTSWRV